MKNQDSTPSFRSVRWTRTINLLLQAVLFVTLFASLNYIARHYAWRFDFTQHHRYSLSPETLSYLKNLAQPVRIIVTLTNDSENEHVTQAYRDVTALLREYKFATGDNPHGGIAVEQLDILQRRRDAEALDIDRPNSLFVICGNNRREVTLNELYLVENQQKKAFLGEQAITAAILDVSQSAKKKIYFLQGHGEMTLDDVSPDRGLSSLHEHLRLRNYDLAHLDLAQTRRIPDDAALVIVAGPQGRCTPAEEELLRQYLTTRAGRLIALLAPVYPHGLDNLLFDWGILVDDVLIYDNGSSGQSGTGDLILHATEAEHLATLPLRSYRIPLQFGATRSVRPDPGRAIDNNLAVTPLVQTSATAWGERSYRLRSARPRYNPDVDIAPPLDVATASERVTARGNLPFSVPGGRLLVVGSADWIANASIANIGNLSFLLASVNWATDRDTELKVPARPVQYYQFSLTQTQLTHLRLYLILLIPGVLAIIGLAVYWTRRN